VSFRCDRRATVFLCHRKVNCYRMEPEEPIKNANPERYYLRLVNKILNTAFALLSTFNLAFVQGVGSDPFPTLRHFRL
jgi:hypothetical protein